MIKFRSIRRNDGRTPIWAVCLCLAGASLLQFAVSSCRNGSKAQDEPTTAVVNQELPLPVPPDILTSPESRADFIITHFWDEMDFTDSSLSLDTAFMEQNLVNFIQLYDYASEESRTKGAIHLLGKASVSGTAYRFVADIAERYLLDPNSPMRNEEFFLPFIQEITGDTVFSPAEKIRYEYLKSRILKNRPGTVGADFHFVDREGKRRRLGDAVKGTDYTLLLFYDYDCETCADVEKEMMTNQEVNSAIASGMLHVVAVNVFGDDLTEWKRQAATLPGEWTVGYSPDCEVTDKEIYCIDAAPTFYLLDSDRRVILKDSPLERVTVVLDNLSRIRIERGE